MGTLSAAEIADICSGKLQGDPGQTITGANSLGEAQPHELSFVSNSAKAQQLASQSRAGCLLVPRGLALSPQTTCIAVDDPRAAFAQVLAVLYARPKPKPFIHATAVIDSSASLANDITIGPHVVIEANVCVGSGCEIGAGSVLGEGVQIGEQTVLFANVTIYRGVQIGSRVILHSGCVLGADGFGFALVGDSYRKFPQVGTVVIEDDVELGANTCIDRATLGRTVVGRGSKLDNLVHVAHNVQIGRHVVVAAQTGFSGGVTVGDHAIIGGQVGIGDKAEIASRAVVGSGSGILTKAKVTAGEPVWGTPARPLRQHLRGLAHINRLARYRSELKELQEEVKILRDKA